LEVSDIEQRVRNARCQIGEVTASGTFQEGLAGSQCVERLRMIPDGRRPFQRVVFGGQNPDLRQAIFVSNIAH